MVDVTVVRDFNAPPKKVAAVMFDAKRDPEWIGGARAAEPLGPEPYGIGYRVKRTGGFLGRSFSWVTEIGRYEPGRKVELNDLYAQSDFISVHPPLMPQTRRMINDDAFGRMKPNAFIINCSRGPIIDTAALVQAPAPVLRPRSSAQPRAPPPLF